MKSENATDQILQFVADKKIDVLLDPGALVMQKSNEIFALEWLKFRKDKIAVVYYNANNNVMTMMQNGSVIRLQYLCMCWTCQSVYYILMTYILVDLISSYLLNHRLH